MQLDCRAHSGAVNLSSMCIGWLVGGGDSQVP